MPKPWEYDWSGGGDPSGLNLLPIVPFFGGQRPPMLGEDGAAPSGPVARPVPTAGPPFVESAALLGNPSTNSGPFPDDVLAEVRDLSNRVNQLSKRLAIPAESATAAGAFEPPLPSAPWEVRPGAGTSRASAEPLPAESRQMSGTSGAAPAPTSSSARARASDQQPAASDDQLQRSIASGEFRQVYDPRAASQIKAIIRSGANAGLGADAVTERINRVLAPRGFAPVTGVADALHAAKRNQKFDVDAKRWVRNTAWERVSASPVGTFVNAGSPASPLASRLAGVVAHLRGHDYSRAKQAYDQGSQGLASLHPGADIGGAVEGTLESDLRGPGRVVEEGFARYAPRIPRYLNRLEEAHPIRFPALIDAGKNAVSGFLEDGGDPLGGAFRKMALGAYSRGATGATNAAIAAKLEEQLGPNWWHLSPAMLRRLPLGLRNKIQEYKRDFPELLEALQNAQREVSARLSGAAFDQQKNPDNR